VTLAVALGIEAVAAWLCVTGMMALAPDEPTTAGTAALACEASISVMAFWVARPLPRAARLAMACLLLPLMGVADTGIATKLSAAHLRHRAMESVAGTELDRVSAEADLWSADLADARRALAALDASVDRREASAQFRGARDLRAEQAGERSALAGRIDRDSARLEEIARQRADAAATRAAGAAKDSPARFVADALGIGDPERLVYVLVIVVSLTLPLVKILMWSVASLAIRPALVAPVSVAAAALPPEPVPAPVPVPVRPKAPARRKASPPKPKPV
jgi:hypothetical protein